MRKKTEAPEPFDYEQAYLEISSQMQGIHIMRSEEMPRIELYLDQLISLVSTELSPLYEPGDKIVTGSMVNNYVKQKVMPAPTRRRYNRTHLAALMFVCCLKRVLTISQVSSLLLMLDHADVDVELAYDELAGTLERATAARFPQSLKDVEDDAAVEIHMNLVDRAGNPVTGELPAIMESAVSLVANRAFVEKLLALEAHRN